MRSNISCYFYFCCRLGNALLVNMQFYNSLEKYFSITALGFTGFGVLCHILWRIRRRQNNIDSKKLPIFISGCDTGIGHKLAICFSELGCDVFAGCLDPETARTSLPDSIHTIPLDVTDDGSVQSAVEQVRIALEKNGRDLWALINNAGVCVYGQFEWQTWTHCEKQIQVNVLGTMRLTKAFIPLLRKSKGRIITMSSVNGSIAYPGLSVYSATKFALEGFASALRLELTALHNIKVIVVQPGDYAKLTSIMSRHKQNAQEMWDNMSSEDKEKYGDFFQKYHKLTLKNYGLTSPNTFEGCHLLKHLKEAVLKVDPKDKYVSAPFGYRIIYSFLALSPSFVTDFVLNKITEKLFNE